MHPYPHTYIVSASGRMTGSVLVCSPQLPGLETAPPPEFDGPGGVWSPETLLCAAVADCFILTFRGGARAARMEWLNLECSVEGALERVEGQSRFTRFTTIAKLSLPAGADPEKARRLLEKAERGCLISNSLRASRALQAQILLESPRDRNPSAD
jgi:organic hydroperoxide reductase OsmC/OhrA